MGLWTYTKSIFRDLSILPSAAMAGGEAAKRGEGGSGYLFLLVKVIFKLIFWPVYLVITILLLPFKIFKLFKRSKQGE